MHLLALDTSAAHCAAALLSDGSIVSDRSEPMAKGQAERLLPLAGEVLAEAGLGWGDLSGLGVGIGPGNFTGIRIAVSAVRGLALALDIPAIGVSSFEAHAHGRAGPLAVVLDARRERVYLQVFGDQPLAPCLVELRDVASMIGAAQILTDMPDEFGRITTSRVLGVGAPSAARIAEVAAARFAHDLPPPAPLYLRHADAALPSEPPVVILDDA